MLKNRSKRFFVLAMLVTMFMAGGVQEIHAANLQINVPQITCINLARNKKGRVNKKYKGNSYKNIMWEEDFLNKDIIRDFTKNSKEMLFNDEDGVLVKKLRRRMFVKKIICQVLEFFIDEF